MDALNVLTGAGWRVRWEGESPVIHYDDGMDGRKCTLVPPHWPMADALRLSEWQAVPHSEFDLALDLPKKLS